MIAFRILLTVADIFWPLVGLHYTYKIQEISRNQKPSLTKCLMDFIEAWILSQYIVPIMDLIWDYA